MLNELLDKRMEAAISREEGIQRCKAIVARYHALDKKKSPFDETKSLVEETLRLFPNCKEDDALYPVEELIDMYQDFDTILRFDSIAHAKLPAQRILILGLLLGYFERNGPGTPYLKALSLFATVQSGFIFFRFDSSYDDVLKIVLRSFDVVLNRVDREASQDPADCASMLKSLAAGLSGLFYRERLVLSIREEYFKKAISLCKTYPEADCRVLIGLYNVAYRLIGISIEDVTFQARLREELIKAFLEIKHPDQTKLEVLSAWHVNPHDVPLFAFKLLPLGLQLVRQMPDRVNAFLESVYGWLLTTRLCFLLMLHMPEVMVLIEETASRESVPAVQCLLLCLTGEVRDLETQEDVFSAKCILLDAGVQITEESDFTLVESWQRRLLLKAVELFSVPSPLTETEGAEKLRVIVQEIIADSKVDALHPLLELWSTHLVDNRYSWTHRLTVFSREYQGPPGSLSNSNRIWMHDSSRYSATSTKDLKIAASILKSIRKRSRQDPLRKYNVDLILLLTWLKAPVILQRLKTTSKLALLNTDILRRLARMIGSNTKDILNIRLKPAITV